MSHDDIRVFLVDDAGNDLGRFEVTYSRELKLGQDVRLSLGGPERLYRVLGMRPGEGGMRFVQVVEAPTPKRPHYTLVATKKGL
jgi:hypothetical protein